MQAEMPEFTSSKAAGFFRSVWRGFNDWLGARGMRVYAGYNRDIVWGERLEKEALPGVKRVWMVNTQKGPAAKVWLPQVNAGRAGHNPWTPFDPNKAEWLKGRFHLAWSGSVGEADLWLFEAAAKAELKGGKR